MGTGRDPRRADTRPDEEGSGTHGNIAHPPRPALLLLRLLAGREAREFIEGDLVEEFHERIVPEQGVVGARRWFWRQALASALRRLVRRRGRRIPRRVGGGLRPGGAWGGGGESLLQDFRFAVRALRRRPAYTLTAVTILAVGVGAVTSVFSVADWLLFKPVPGVGAPPELLALVEFQQPDGNSTGVSYPNILDLGVEAPAVEALAGAAPGQVQVGGEGIEARPLEAEAITEDYFELLEVRAHRGRLFSREELAPGAERAVAVISHRMWSEDLRADPSIPGRTLSINGRSYDVVGVAGRGFVGTGRAHPVDLWIPAGLYPSLRHFPEEWSASRRDRRFFMRTVARLAPGAKAEQAQTELRDVMERLVNVHPDANAIHEEYQPTLHAGIGTPPHARAHQRNVVATMFAVAGLFLLIACANQTNLLVLRNATRQGETAVRRALGASQRRLARQHLVEALLISVMAGVLAAGLAWGLNRIFWPEGEGFLGVAALGGAPLDVRVFIFALSVAVTVPLLFALLPATRVGKLDVASTLQGAGRTTTGRRTLLRGSLIVLQLSLSLALLVGSLLLVRTLQGLIDVDPGFDSAGLLAFSSDPAPQGYDREESARFHLELLDRVRDLPGVQAATLAPTEPLRGWSTSNWIVPPGGEGVEPRLVRFEWIGPEYFSTLGVQVRQGRQFRPEEVTPGSPASEGVVILNRSLARQLFGTGDAVDRSVTVRGPDGDVEKRVVGVVPDIRGHLRGEPEAVLYEPLPHSRSSHRTLLVRTSRPLGAMTMQVRTALGGIDPDIPLLRAVSVDETVMGRIAEERMLARLLSVLALLAGLLAAVGLYSVVGWSVTERTREIGIRVALGAAPAWVVGRVVRGVLMLAVLGVILGCAISIGVTQILRNRLFGVEPFDPLVWSLAAGLLVTVTLLAAAQPARRAAAVDPTEALRSE